MKERGILFSGPMVRAILSGEKTQTRRVVKKEMHGFNHVVRGQGPERPVKFANRHGGVVAVIRTPWVTCPHGVPGDRLWVREAWYCDDFTVGDFDSDLSTKPVPTREERIGQWREAMYYRADGEPQWEQGGTTPWKPSIFMPRWASRISLEITDIRVERVQEISGQDATAEGVDRRNCYGPHCPAGKDGCNARGCAGAREGFEGLWDSINSERGFGWNNNPWVWAISFNRVTP